MLNTLKLFLLISLLGCVPLACDARVQPTSLPRTLQGYLDTCRRTGDLTQQPGEAVFWMSIQQYIAEFVKYQPNMTREEIAFLRNTVNLDLLDQNPGRSTGRFQRQAVAPRLRKEIRSMTDGERTRYFNAVNALKHDTRLRPNIYDVLAGFHSGTNIQRAHFGPAFPGWHRLYLYLFESFLRLHDPDVTVPFWASDLDNEMTDPTQCIIWSDAFFGPGVGLPTSGPFRAWQAANSARIFNRNVGGGQLYTYEGIQNILRRTRNRDILMPTARSDSNFEQQHGGPHTFVSGTMNSLQTAAFDPIFFSHHAYVDHIWERFRFGQRNAGINTEADYPFDERDPRFRPMHNPRATTGFFPNGEIQINWVQQTGYSDAFYRIVQYERVPQCPDCNGSPYLFCNNNRQPPRCQCVSMQQLRMTNSSLVDQLPGVSPTGNANVVPGRRGRRSLHNSVDVCHPPPFLNDVNVDLIQNTANERIQSQWVYVPVKVVTKRPISYNKFNKYSLYNKGALGQIASKGELIKQPIQKKYPSCYKKQDAVGKVKITAYGLNYEGYSEEYAIVDNRLGVTESTAFIPVHVPSGSKPSEVIITAFDSCGRVCRPHCTSGVDGSMVRFSGGVRLTIENPLHYGRTYADAMFDVWDVQGTTACPNINYNNIPVSFFCEYTDHWIWDNHTMGSLGQMTIDERMVQNVKIGINGQLGRNIQTGINESIGTNPQMGVNQRTRVNRPVGVNRQTGPALSGRVDTSIFDPRLKGRRRTGFKNKQAGYAGRPGGK